MLWARIALTLASLAVCSFAPGFLAVRRLPWRPLEKICGALAASLIGLYLLTFAIYCFLPRSETVIFRAASCIAAGMAIWQWRDIRRLARSFGARQALTGFGFLLLWSLLALGIIRNYSGALWMGDWLEHFQRSLFFLYHLPTQTNIIGLYALPARPPLMNLLPAFFMAQTFFPCCLLVHRLLQGGKSRYLPLIALFALNPMMMENAWYAWTKLFACFFVLFAICLYLAALRKSDTLRMVSAFVLLAGGLLVHYSAGPYMAFLAGHYLLRAFAHRSNGITELGAIALCCGLLLITWVGWSIKHYGVRATLASNTSVTSSQQYQGSTAGKIAANLWDTIAPPILRDPGSLAVFDQPNRWGELRDNFFSAYQTNLIFAMGSIGGPLAIWLLYGALRNPRSRGREFGFWLAFIPSLMLLGIAVVGERDSIGLAHLTLIPLVALGVTFIAANFPWKRATALLLLAGCLIDFTFGIFLHLRVQNMENTPQRTVFPGLKIENDEILPRSEGPDTLGGGAWNNWIAKHREELLRKWVGEVSALRQTPSNRSFIADLQNQLAENARDFGGWYGRNDGHLTLLGDDLSQFSVGGIDVASVLFLLLFLALTRAFWKEAIRFAPAITPRPPVPRMPSARRRQKVSRA
jgi:hypothetical protein